MITVACVYFKSQQYSTRYVNILHAAVKRQMTVPFKFVCLTNSKENLFYAGIHTEPLMQNWPRCWPMIELFRPGVFEGPVVYFDLDTYLIGNIDWITEPYDGPLMGLEDFNFKGKYASGVMRFTPSAITEDLYTHLTDPKVFNRVKGYAFQDEQYTAEHLKEKGIRPDFLQHRYPGRIVSYKIDVKKGVSLEGVSVVCCHGVPKPHEIHHPVLSQHWKT